MIRKISLIMGTLGRHDEIGCFFDSIKNTGLDLEMIVVDQNPEGYLADIIERYSEYIKIIHISESKKGLSHARNVGLKYATGDIICFPDDDCVYSEGLLKSVVEYFDNNENDILTVAYNKPTNKIKHINQYNMFRHHISFTIFIKPKKNNDISFDETLGCGCKYGSSEETYMLYKLLKKNYICDYNGYLNVFHPQKNEINLDRVYSYGLGSGRLHFLIFKESFIDAIYIVITTFMKTFLKLILFMITFRIKRIREINYTLKGRWNGFFNSIFDR